MLLSYAPLYRSKAEPRRHLSFCTLPLGVAFFLISILLLADRKCLRDHQHNWSISGTVALLHAASVLTYSS